MAERQPPQSFSFAAGEGFSIPFNVDQVITGMTPRFAMKRRPGSADVLTSVGGGATASATVTAPQVCTVAVTDENTEALRGTYRYSVEIEDAGGGKSEIAWGYMTFSPSMV